MAHLVDMLLNDNRLRLQHKLPTIPLPKHPGHHRFLPVLQLAHLPQGSPILATLWFTGPIREPVSTLQSVTETTSADVLAGQVAFHLGLPAILTGSPQFRGCV